jgi:transposase InsO family protein
MKIHRNARLTLKGRLELARSVVQRGVSVVDAAEQYRVSTRTAAKWVSRFKAEGEVGLSDRSSRPHTLRALTPARIVRRIERLRRERMTIVRIASVVGVSRSTVSRVLARAGLSKLGDLDPEEPVVRYERARPGELLHIDTKKLGRIARIGHRITGDRRDQVRGIGWETVFIAVDDHSRVAFAELAADETIDNAVAFLRSAVDYYGRLGVTISAVMTDNGSAFRSRAFAAAMAQLDLRHLTTRPYTPKTNGKAERFIQSALREWAYGFVYHNSGQRSAMLNDWVHHYNWHRPHSSLGAKPPMSRIPMRPNNLLRRHS